MAKQKKNSAINKRFSFLGLGVTAILLLLIATSLALFFLSNLYLPSLTNTETAERSKALSRLLYSQLSNQINSRQLLVNHIATDNKHLIKPLQRIKSLDSIEQQKLAYRKIQGEFNQEVRQVIPGALDVRALPFTISGSAGLQKLGIQLNNNVELLLYSKVTLNKPYTAEVYKIDNQWRITFASPITENSKTLGVLFVSFSVAFFDPLLKSKNSLIQGVSLLTNHGKSVYQVGRLNTFTSTIKSPIPQVQLAVSPMPNNHTATPFLLYMSILIIALIATVLCIISLKIIHRMLSADSVALTQYVQTLSSVHDAQAPALNFSLLRPLLEAIIHAKNHIHKNPLNDEDLNQTSTHNPSQRNEVIPDTKIKTINHQLAHIPDEVFRDYDIRGQADTQITANLAYQIGKAVGSKAIRANQTKLAVGCDGRLSSPKLKDSLIKGLLNTGCDVIDIGTVSSPALYFATHHLGTQAGIIVTASHNAGTDNGFKIILEAQSLTGKTIQKIKHLIKTQQYEEGKGKLSLFNDINEAYVQTLKKDIIVARPLKVVLDAANGAGGPLGLAVLQAIDCDVIPLYCDIDGHFPNHAPDPCKAENLEALINEVKKQQADLGFALDGDADRLVVVTGSGNILSGDQLLMLFSADIAATNPGTNIVFDVKCSPRLPRAISNAGARPILCKTGHSNIKHKMHETKALLGGEFTGHFCFKDRWFGFDDGMYAGARLLEHLAMSNTTLEETYQTFEQTFATPELLIPVKKDSDKFIIIRKLSEYLQHENAEIITLDGVRLEYPDKFGIIRASNTGAMLTARFEGASEKALEEIIQVFQTALKRIDTHLILPV